MESEQDNVNLFLAFLFQLYKCYGPFQLHVPFRPGALNICAVSTLGGSSICKIWLETQLWPHISLRALPGYMDMAVYNVIMHFSTVMWLHFRNVATNLIGHICSHISEM